MTGNVIVRPLAAADVRDAAFWYESQREDLGVEFTLEVDAIFDHILESPHSFPEIGEQVRRALVRRFPYAVYFVIADQLPIIIAVLHQHRRPDAWRERT